jgi:hypothetical protein
VGFANGSVTVVRGDLVHDRGAKQRTVHESEEPITGVEFREESRIATLYVATTSRILKLAISGRGQGQAPRPVEDSGCGIGCMTLDKRTGDIVVVRDDAIYYYGIEGRGPCYAYDGPKSLVSTFGDYVALVSPPTNTSTSTKSSALHRFGGSQADEIFNTSTFTLLDTGLKFVAHSESVVSQIQTLFSIWGDLFTLTQDGKVSGASQNEGLLLIMRTRFIVTMRKPCNKDLKYCIRGISLCQPSILHRSPVWMHLNRT